MDIAIVVTPDELRQLLSYDPDSGKLFWKSQPASCFKNEGAAKAWNSRFSGKEAFKSPHICGYLAGCIRYKKYLAHRVGWAIYHGQWPAEQIDHINGDKKDNRIANLREATRSENAHNVKRTCRNISGFKGVSFDTNRQKWISSILCDGKQRHVGRFDTAEAAYAAYCKAALKYHGEFARLE